MQSFNGIIFWHENIFKMDHLKHVYLTELTDDARKKHLPSAVKTEISHNTSSGMNQFKKTLLTAWFSTPIFLSFGVEMKTIGNLTAPFTNIYLPKLTKSKIHGAFTCLLIVWKSVSHGRLRVLTRTLKVGVRDSSSVKNTSPTFKKFINCTFFHN